MADQYRQIGGTWYEIVKDTGSTRNGAVVGAPAVAEAFLRWGDDATNNIVRTGGKGGGWAVNHAPAVNTKATISQAAGAVGVKNVCTGFSWMAATGTTAPAALQVTVNLRDGATGAGTVLWAWTFVFPASVGYNFGVFHSGLWIEGSAAVAMTLEFTAAGGANTFESVALCGVTIS